MTVTIRDRFNREIRRYRRLFITHMVRGVASGVGTTAVGLIVLWWQTRH